MPHGGRFERTSPDSRARRRSRTASGLRRIPLQPTLSTCLLLVAILFGGGTRPGLLSDAIAQLASLPVLGLALATLIQTPLSAAARMPLILLACGLLLALLQLVPLPPTVWTMLPGREQFASTYAIAGIATPWLPISLDPASTWRSVLALLPAVALFLSVLNLDLQARRRLALLVVPLALFGVVLGLAQVAKGPDSALRFYRPTNPAVAVGMFANPNHFAIFLAAAMPLATVATAWISRQRRLRPTAALAIDLALFAVLLLGMVATGSRAGLVLGLCAGAASLAILRSGPAPGMRAPLWVIAAGGASLLAIAAFGLLLALGRTEASADVFRLEMYRNTLAAAAAFFPAGTGFGTFEQIYRMFEAPETVSRIYVNHAHNDWLELLLEGGLPAALLAGAAVLWLASTARLVWSGAPQGVSGFEAMLPKAGFVIAAVLLLHSLVDYPLRTTADAVLFAFGCALLVPPLGGTGVPFAVGPTHRLHRAGGSRRGR